MLSNLASYLGYQFSSTEEEPEKTASTDVRLRVVEEDEWLLVEKQKPCDTVLTTSTCPSVLPGARPNNLQESWYLTPPPSFTSRGPVFMETSPLENLLIEHPSMSVYQKSESTPKRKSSNPSSSASEEDSSLRQSSEDGMPVLLPRKERFNKLQRNKYSKKITSKRAPTSSSDEAISLPSASEDDEKKEPKVKNFVKSPRRFLAAELRSPAKKPPTRRNETSSSDAMISKSSNNEEVWPAISALALQPFSPPRRLYSDVLRSKPKTPVVSKPTLKEEPQVATSPTDDTPAIDSVDDETASNVDSPMAVEESVADKNRRRTVQSLPPTQLRQHFLNRSAQKLEQRKTYETAKRNLMGRNNKAREMNSRNKRQRRSDMMQRHSGANNNRKCC